MKEKIKVKERPEFYLQWPVTLSALLVIMNLITGAVNLMAGLAVCGLMLIYIVIALQIYVYKRRHLMTGLVEFSTEYVWVQRKLLMDLDLPYTVADETGRILWMNREFLRVFKEGKGSGGNLVLFFPEATKETLTELKEAVNIHCEYRGSKYRVNLRPVFTGEDRTEVTDALGSEADRRRLIAIYLFDETEILKYRQEINDQKVVAGPIYLGNYEEALESVEEMRRSLLMALIDRKASKYIVGMNGVVKKLGKGKYFFTIKQQYVQELQDSRFPMLEEVKTVNTGNGMAITLSIGMGMNGETHNQDYDFACITVGMALRRGGDQVVAKDAKKIQYYGGKSQQLKKTMRVKAQVKAHAPQELMETEDRLLIIGHRLSDTGSFGAVVGIYRIAASLNRKANIVINEATPPMWPTMERLMNNPDYPEDLFLMGGQTVERVDASMILVVVDVNRPNIMDAPALLHMVKATVVLDRHRQSNEIIDNAALSYVEPHALPTCEMVTEVSQYIANGIKIKSPEADIMYIGIVIDTNDFTNQTGVRTFEATAYLRQSGADITRVRKLFRGGMNDYKVKTETVWMVEVSEGTFVISVCPVEGAENPVIAAVQAANELLDINGMKASVVLSQYNGTIYLSAYPVDGVNVQIMMEKLGSGGRRTIVGAQFPGITIEEAIGRLKTIIIEMLEKGDIP